MQSGLFVGADVSRPPCGILLADYWVVRRRQLNLANLYRLGKGTEQYYTYGFNLRAIAAFLCGVAPTLPGFIKRIGNYSSIPIGTSYVYACVWPVGVVVAGGVYIILNLIWPHRWEARGSHVDRASADETYEAVDEKKL